MPTKFDSAATLDGFASIDGWTYTRLHAPTHLKLEVTPPPSVGSGDGGGAERPQSMRAKQRETSDDEEEQRLCRPACIIPPTAIKVLHSMVGYPSQWVCAPAWCASESDDVISKRTSPTSIK
jgi:hypothetical protein